MGGLMRKHSRQNPRPMKFAKGFPGGPTGAIRFSKAVMAALRDVRADTTGDLISIWFYQSWPKEWPGFPAASLFSDALVQARSLRIIEATRPRSESGRASLEDRDMEDLAEAWLRTRAKMYVPLAKLYALVAEYAAEES